MRFFSQRLKKRSAEIPSVTVVKPDPRAEYNAFIQNKPQSVRAIPSAGSVGNVVVEWRKPTREEMMDGVTDIATVTTEVPPRYGRNPTAAGRRVLLEQPFRPEVGDDVEFGELGRGVSFLHSTGSLTDVHLEVIREQLSTPPASITTRMNTREELDAWQHAARPPRKPRNWKRLEQDWFPGVRPLIARVVGNVVNRKK